MSNIEREFFDLAAHNKQPHMFPHRFNPYACRCFTPDLSKQFFNAQNFTDENGIHTTPDFAFMGCLDAPEMIPLGAAARIKTVGGWEREEYLHISRECLDWSRHMKASAHMAKLLKEILADVDSNSENEQYRSDSPDTRRMKP